ncbi:bis(5'-nucleosyl)-tetraphosphatase (symmetrical) YqeK [Oceanobacillus sp. CAU 1775]
MEFNEAVAAVKAMLSEKRFSHTMRVVEVAESLAKRYNAQVGKVKLAAVFHDYAKEFPLDELKRLILSSDLPKDLLDFHFELWHGPVGAVVVQEKYGIVDEDILSAIRYHTTGKASMSQIDKIIYLADYIEPGRNFPGLTEVRQAANENLDLACWLISRNTLQHLLNKEVTLYPDSVFAYNDLHKKMEG